MSAHALLSPSSAHCWLNCKAAPAMCIDLPDEASPYAEEGTRAHALAERYLRWSLLDDEFVWAFEIGDSMEMFSHCVTYVNQILQFKADYELAGMTVEILVEQRLPISHLTSEEDAYGTADCVLLCTQPDGEGLIHVCDLKYGYNPVDAVENEQLMMYGAAALREYELLGDFNSVVMSIHQPRISDTPSQWEMEANDLTFWIAATVRPKAEQALLYVESRYVSPFLRSDFNPSKKTCQWCRLGRAGLCGAKDAAAEDAMGFDVEQIEPLTATEDIDYIVSAIPNARLGDVFEKLDFVEDWIKGIRSRVEKELLNGNEVPGCKLVAGRKGRRGWVNEELAEAEMKALRLKKDEMYNLKLISPTDAEKLLAAIPRKWKRVEQFITQADGAPSVTLASDKRPALTITPVVEMFEIIKE